MALIPTTWNPSDKGASVTLSGGNLVASTNYNGLVRSIWSASSGKWYWEFVLSVSTEGLVGIAKSNAKLEPGPAFPGVDANGWSMYCFNGFKYNNGSSVAYNGGAVALGTVIGVKLDLDAGTLSFTVGGVDKGIAFSGLSGTFFATFGGGSSGGASTCTANFGASAFTYSVPSGYNPGFGSAYAITGNVLDDTGAAAARLVRVHRRFDGALLATAYTNAGEANYASVSTLVHGDGATVTYPVPDASPFAKVYTANGSFVLSGAQKKWGLGSMLFNGTNAFLTTPASSEFLLGSGDFTLEGWIRPSVVNVLQKVAGVWSDTTGSGFSYKLEVTTTGRLQFVYSTTGANSFTITAGSGSLVANTWYHVCVERVGTTAYLFVDGTLVGSASVSGVTMFAVASTKLFEIGRDGAGATNYFNGYMQDIRLTKGVGRYATGGFTAPTDRFPDSAARALGALDVPMASTDEVYLVACDDVAGTVLNDVVARAIPA